MLSTSTNSFPSSNLNIRAFIARTYKEKAMAPRSSTLAWEIPWREEAGRLKSMGSLRVGYD